MISKIMVINDVHMYAPHQLFGSVKEFLNKILWEKAFNDLNDVDIYPIGDNFDANHCPKKKIDEFMVAGQEFKLRFKDNFIAGNHEIGVFGNDPEFRVINTIRGRYLLTHGDLPFWGAADAYKYRNDNKIGASAFKRFFVGKFDEFRHALPVKLKPDYIERAELYMKKYDCIGIIQGHKHPETEINQMINGKHHIVLPRGINIVRFDKTSE